MFTMKKEKLPKDQQERNDAYNAYVKQVTPTHNLWVNMAKAFLLGGIICTLGQLIVNIAMNQFGLEQKDAFSWCSMILVLCSVILTSTNLYPSLANWGGAGALVPITGFANGVCASAIEFQKEGQVFGIGSQIFKIAGPVILYGIFSSWILGLIYWVLGLLGLVG
jgi:stage V sporulation protein AC